MRVMETLCVMTSVSDPFGTRATAAQIMAKARDVIIVESGIAALAAVIMDHPEFVNINSNQSPILEWDTAIHFHDGTEKTLNWLLALDTINFSFWPEPGSARWEVETRMGWVNGYSALAYSLKRGVDEGFGFWNAAFLASLPLQRFRYVVRGRGEIPLLEERVAHLREVGGVLQGSFHGNFAELIEASQKSAVKTVRLITENFPSFRDEFEYDGIPICFYKRAQILVADIYHAFSGKSYGEFHDMKALTAFADYKLPQILRHHNAIRYSEKLGALIDSRILIPSGSPMEIEIRAATVVAVERMAELLGQKGISIYPITLDSLLWKLSQELPANVSPYHLTRSIYY